MASHERRWHEVCSPLKIVCMIAMVLDFVLLCCLLAAIIRTARVQCSAVQSGPSPVDRGSMEMRCMQMESRPGPEGPLL